MTLSTFEFSPFFWLLQENGKTWTNRHLRLLHRIAMLVIVFASTISASTCRNHSVSILKEPKSYSFIALKAIFINFRETRLARVSKRFVSTNFPSDIALTNWVRGPYSKTRTEFFFRLGNGPSAKREGKTRFHNLQVGPRKGRLVRYS